MNIYMAELARATLEIRRKAEEKEEAERAAEAEKQMRYYAEFVDDKTIAKITSTSPALWRKLRLNGGQESPPFIKLGKTVRYHLPTFLQWMRAREQKP